MSTMLSEFPRTSPPTPADTSSRVSAGLLTLALYGLLALVIWSASMAVPSRPAMRETVATLLRDPPKKSVVEPVPPVDLIGPRAEQPAPPVFTIGPGAPPQAPAPLPASAATASPLTGGTAGDGTMGQAASGNGSNGNGAGGGCLDPAWVRAVTERVRQFFYYPGAALAARTTGVVMVHFTVRRNGRIDRLQVSQSSGNDGLDKAAMDIVRKAQPLPPIPDRMRTDRVEGDLPINFGVRSFAGMPNKGNCPT
jgi:protein TonB